MRALVRTPVYAEKYQGVIPALDYPNVSANRIVMAALRGGHPEKHGYSGFPAGWPGQAQP
jgi:hypothetical protein